MTEHTFIPGDLVYHQKSDLIGRFGGYVDHSGHDKSISYVDFGAGDIREIPTSELSAAR
jgi:hypothetical protein